MKNSLRTLLTLLLIAGGAVAQPLRFIAPKHLGVVEWAQLSPDGKFTLISGEGGVSLWETATARRIAQLQDGNSNLPPHSAIAWNPDGRTFAVAVPGKVQIWSLDTLQPLRSIAPSDPKAKENYPDNVEAMTFDATGKTLATGSYDRSARLWEVASGRLLQTFRGDSFALKGHNGAVTGLAFAKNGKWLITASKDSDARVWDVATGKTIRIWNNNHWGLAKNMAGPNLNCLAVAPDGVTVAVGDGGFNRSKGSDIFLWNAETGATLRTLHVNNYDAGINAVAFSPNGQTLLTGASTYGAYDDPLILWNVASGKRIKTFTGHIKMLGAVNSAQFSRDGKTVLSSSADETVRLWSVASGQNTRVFSGSSLGSRYSDLSFDGKWMLSGLENGQVRISDVSSGRVLRSFDAFNSIDGVKFSPDARFAAATGNLKVVVWEIESGRKIGEAKTGFAHDLEWSADNSRLLCADHDSYELFAVETAGLKKISGHYVQNNRDVTLSRDGQRVYAAYLYTKIMVIDAQSDKLVRNWTSPAQPKQLAISSDESLLAGLSDGNITVWNAQSGAQISAWTTKNAAAIAFDANSAATLVAQLGDGTLRFFEARSGQNAPDTSNTAATPFVAGGRLLLDETSSLALKTAKIGATRVHYLSLQGGDWLAYTDDGRFDGSAGGIAKVSFARGKQTFTLEQFSERFYRPGLLQQVLGGTASVPTASAQTTLAQGAPPTVRIVSPQGGAAAKEQIEVSVEATEQNNGGIKAIRLYQNGRLVGGPSALRGIVVEAAPQSANSKIQKFNITLAPGDNALRAVAYSQTDLESAPAEVKISFAGTTQKPALRVLVVGINEYKDATMNLAYARPDAESLAQFFEAAGKANALFSSVSVTKLVDEAATGDAIKTAMNQLAAQSKPEDVVFVYLAGHGDTAAENSVKDADDNAAQTFYFLPYEMRQMIIKDRVRQYGLSGEAINALIAKIPARKIVLIYDSCKSGAAITGASRGAGDEQQALAQLARAQGIYVLAAATGQQYAGEVKSLGHGILTYALLEGLGGKAAGADSIIKVSQLFAYTEDRVPELAKQYRGREQWPVPFTKGQNFPLVMK